MKKINKFTEKELKAYLDKYRAIQRDATRRSRSRGEVDVKGALQIKQTYPNSVLIFIVPPSIEELKKRLVKRNTETEEDLIKRVERAEMELSFENQFDYAVVNDRLENAIEKVKEIIQKEI